jgi:hypothetical protein
MSRLTLLLLAIATVFLTPAGVYVCGSVTPTLFLPGDGHGLIVPSDGAVNVQLVETAVSTYLSTPFLATADTAVFLTPILILATAPLFCALQLTKRKPPTPPPY